MSDSSGLGGVHCGPYLPIRAEFERIIRRENSPPALITVQ